MRRDFIFLLLAVCLGALLRLDLLISNNFVIDADEAIVGLMANHIVQGDPIPTFYYGQHYMGSLEAIFAAALFAIWGSSAVALKLVPFFFSLILIILVYKLAFNSIGRTGARIAALLCAVPPSALVIWSSMARGGFIELVVLGAIAFLLVQKWLVSPQPGLKLVFAIGFVLGLGWWVNNQILYFMLPTALCMALNILGAENQSKRIHNFILVGVVGTLSWLIGGLPYWIYNIKNNWASLGMFEPAKSSELLQYFNGLYQVALPILLGGSRFWQIEDTFPGSKTIIALLYGFFIVSYLILRRKNLLQIFCGKVDKKNCLELFFFLLISCSVIFVTSSFGWLAQAPRYLLPMYISIFVLSAYVLSVIWNQSKVVAGTLLSVLIFCNLASSYWGGRSIPGEPIVFRGDRVSKDHSQLISWLYENNISWVKTNYWIGYRLAFETNERVRFLVNQEPAQTRIESWPKIADSIKSETMPLVMVPSQARYVREAFKILNYKYEEEILSGYHVFHDIEIPNQGLQRIANEEIEMYSELNTSKSSEANDGSLHTRWGSGVHQRPGMQFTITLKTPQPIRAITYGLGDWPQDYPRGLQIEFEKPSGERILYFDSRGWESLKYLLEMQSELSFFTKGEEISKIIFTQTKAHPVFDWTIAEINLFK